MEHFYPHIDSVVEKKQQPEQSQLEAMPQPEKKEQKKKSKSVHDSPAN